MTNNVGEDIKIISSKINDKIAGPVSPDFMFSPRGGTLFLVALSPIETAFIRNAINRYFNTSDPIDDYLVRFISLIWLRAFLDEKFFYFGSAGQLLCTLIYKKTFLK